jgi:RNA polymerase sigma-70 factor (ECF subfamily)
VPEEEVQDEVAMVGRAIAGDRSAFDQLVRDHQGRLRSFLALRLGHRQQALVDDLAQDSFLIAYQRLQTFEPGRPFQPWLRGIAWNLMRAQLRRSQAQAQDASVLQDRFDDRVQRRLEGEAEVDRISLLRRCLEGLQETTVALVRAHYFDGESLEQIACREQRRPSAIGMALMRARRRLAACIQARLQDPVLGEGTGA